MATTQRDLKKAGIPTQRRPTPRLRKNQSSMKGWMAISVFMVITVWASTGLLGFYPTIIASGSMRPTMDVGDIAIVIPVDSSKIQVGDIIQYWQEGEMTLHRVADINQAEGSRLFITKGDDNPIPDSNPIFPAQIKGKLILTIPKLGWMSIHLKTAIANVWMLFSTNITLAYGTLTTLTLGITTYAYKKRTNRKWKRRW